MNEKILITGADGFIGSHLTELLTKEGAIVKALSQYNSFNNRGWLEDVDCINDIEIFSGDVRDPHYCKRITKGIDVIFHLAALIAIPYSYIAPDSYIDTNIKGTLNICQAALDNDCQKVIITSTSEVYGTAQYVPIDEYHPLQGQSPYSASKIGADKIAESFYRSFDLPVIIARPFNTYGPRQSARAIIPTIVTQLITGMKEIHLGSLEPTRDLTYVSDTCHGFLAIAQNENAVGKTFNIGSGKEITISDLADQIIALINPDAKIVEDSVRKRPTKSEVNRLLCSNKHIHEVTGWEPTVSLVEGLMKSIEWFKKADNLQRYKADIYNI